MDHGKKIGHIAGGGSPGVAKLFKEYDGVDFASFGCSTSHGEDMAAVEHKMPNGLFPMTQGEAYGFAADGGIGAFMATKVAAAIAPLLDGAPFNPETGEHNLSCFTCHAIKP